MVQDMLPVHAGAALDTSNPPTHHGPVLQHTKTQITFTELGPRGGKEAFLLPLL